MMILPQLQQRQHTVQRDEFAQDLEKICTDGGGGGGVEKR